MFKPESNSEATPEDVIVQDGGSIEHLETIQAEEEPQPKKEGSLASFVEEKEVSKKLQRELLDIEEAKKHELSIYQNHLREELEKVEQRKAPLIHAVNEKVKVQEELRRSVARRGRLEKFLANVVDPERAKIASLEMEIQRLLLESVEIEKEGMRIRKSVEQKMEAIEEDTIREKEELFKHQGITLQ